MLTNRERLCEAPKYRIVFFYNINSVFSDIASDFGKVNYLGIFEEIMYAFPCEFEV